MSKSGPVVEDLSARARRGDLASEDQRRLELALRASLEARLLHQAGLGFDEERSVSRGDDELMVRVVRRLQARPVARRAAVRGRLWPLLAAGMLGATAAAAASWTLSAVVSGHRELGTASRSPPKRAPSVQRAAPRTSAVPTADDSPPASPPQVPAEHRLDPKGPTRITRATAAAAEPTLPPERAAEPDSAQKLFSGANALRRSGDVRRATEAYLELERRFPGSAEAKHSHLTLGQLYLAQHAAASALAQFQSYAQAPSSDSLRVEALWGEVEALEMLGRTQQEIGVLEGIVTQHPQSVYREAAEQRLARLRSR